MININRSPIMMILNIKMINMNKEMVRNKINKTKKQKDKYRMNSMIIMINNKILMFKQVFNCKMMKTKARI